MDEEHDDLDGPFECWCGAVGDIDEMLSDDLDRTCGGTGLRNCYCGGDQCVCHWHGSAECDGCEDCEPDPDDDYWDDEYR